MIQEKQPANQAKSQITTNAFPMKLDGSGPTPDKSKDYGGKSTTNVKVVAAPSVPSRACATCSR